MARRNLKYAIFLGAVLLGFLSALSYAQAPVPFISQPLVPDATAPGGVQFILTVNGTGFVSKSVVNWNGSALTTQFVSGSNLTATVPAADIATASTAWVTVVNPPPGGGESNVAFFSVTNPRDSLSLSQLEYAAGTYPIHVIAADFNGDSNLDLVVGNHVGGATVSVFLGNGDGTFQNRVEYATGQWPGSPIAADFNGDGKLDIAVTNWMGRSLSVLLGNGDGTFQKQVLYTVPEYPGEVVSADFNSDGKLDFAVASTYSDPERLTILLGNGDGTFQKSAEYVAGSGANRLVTGDFNRDGKLDLAVANYFGNSLDVFLGNGDGTFQSPVQYPTGTNPYGMEVADFDGDGMLDLVTNNDGDNTLSILLGKGDGTFLQHVDNAVGSHPEKGTLGDFNGDDKLDLAVTNQASDSVSVLLGNGDGAFQQQVQFAVGSGPRGVSAGDFNNDGRLDLVASNSGSETISVLLQLTDGLAVVLSPTNLNFGTQLVRTRGAPQPVTLTNIGSETLNITSIAASAHFSQTNNCGSSVPPGGHCKINVKFKPPFRGTFTGTVTITDNAPTSPQTVPLKGVGTAATLLPSSMNFGDQKVGITSDPQVATLTNYGTAPVNIHRIHITGKNPANFAQTNDCGTSVPPGGSCSISVTFTPKTKGSKTATLEVRDNAGGGPQTVELSGRGTP